MRRLLEHIDRPTTSRLTLVAGASGAGKSSVVRAGLVPALERDERSTTTAIVSVGGTWADTLLTCTDDVLVLDQLESALTTPADAATALAAIADRAQRPDGPWIVATVRADYLDVLLADPAIGLLVEPALVLVPPMSDRELTDAIVEPAARVGVRVADGLTQLLVSDMRERAAGLPLLQYALTETYEANNSGELSIDDYRSVGGLGGALARRAEALIEPMPQDRRDLVRTSLLRLVTLASLAITGPLPPQAGWVTPWASTPKSPRASRRATFPPSPCAGLWARIPRSVAPFTRRGLASSPLTIS